MSYELKDFERDVLERSRQVPVLVDFWAPWCGPCRTLGPVLESMADRAGGRWELVKINTEECQDLAAAFDITSIPAVKLFVDGQVVDGFVGALPEREISRFLEKALPSPHTAQLAEAERLLSEGSYSKATELLEPLVASDPANSRARVLLAQSLLSSAPEHIGPLLAAVADRLRRGRPGQRATHTGSHRPASRTGRGAAGGSGSRPLPGRCRGGAGGRLRGRAARVH